MLTHSQIKKAARLQYQVETRIYGTFFGARIGAGHSFSYDPGLYDRESTDPASSYSKEEPVGKGLEKN